MTVRKYLISFILLISTALGLVAAPTAYAVPSTGPTLADCEGPFYQGDERFGPAVLPEPPNIVGELLRGYRRFGDESDAEDFLRKYWKDDPIRPGWKYPDKGGFEGDTENIKLQTGRLVDRFGPQSGRFLAPIGTPYAQRSLPPQSLNTCEYESDVRMPYGYYRYEVQKEFEVVSGITAKGFGQPGGGTQYMIVTPEGQPRRDVDSLVRDGSLKPIG